MDSHCRFPYHGRWTVVVCVLLFVACALIIGSEARRTFDEGKAVLLWTLTVFSSALGILGLLGLWNRMAGKSAIIFREDGLFLPHGFLHRKIAWIPFVEIRAITEMRAASNRILILETTTQKYSISSVLLPDTAVYEAMKRHLFESMSARHSTTGLN